MTKYQFLIKFLNDAGFTLAAFNHVANRFQNTNLQSHWLSGRSQTCTANEIANSYSEICLQRR